MFDPHNSVYEKIPPCYNNNGLKTGSKEKEKAKGKGGKWKN